MKKVIIVALLTIAFSNQFHMINAMKVDEKSITALKRTLKSAFCNHGVAKRDAAHRIHAMNKYLNKFHDLAAIRNALDIGVPKLDFVADETAKKAFFDAQCTRFTQTAGSPLIKRKQAKCFVFSTLITFLTKNDPASDDEVYFADSDDDGYDNDDAYPDDEA